MLGRVLCKLRSNFIIIVGYITDINTRKVRYEDGLKLSSNFDIPYIELSKFNSTNTDILCKIVAEYF